jgi:hypothetical protein
VTVGKVANALLRANDFFATLQMNHKIQGPVVSIDDAELLKFSRLVRTQVRKPRQMIFDIIEQWGLTKKGKPES